MSGYSYRGQPCYYCGNEAAGYDHVVAQSRGGLDAAANRVPACAFCNSQKSDLSVEEFRLRRGLIEGRMPVHFFGEEPCPPRDFIVVASRSFVNQLVRHNNPP